MVCTIDHTVVKEHCIELSGLDLWVHALVIEIACQLAGNFQKVVWLSEGSACKIIHYIEFQSAVVIELIIFTVGSLLAAERGGEHLQQCSLHFIIGVSSSGREYKKVFICLVTYPVHMKIGNLYICKVYCHLNSVLKFITKVDIFIRKFFHKHQPV